MQGHQRERVDHPGQRQHPAHHGGDPLGRVFLQIEKQHCFKFYCKNVDIVLVFRSSYFIMIFGLRNGIFFFLCIKKNVFCLLEKY